MMGRKAKGQQIKLFYHGFSLENRVRSDHPLRRIKEIIDFDFIYGEVADKYGVNGNVSVPPPVILKLMLLLILYNVRSERELMVTIPERLDWSWFLDLDLDEPIPDHSVLSKARTRWGSAAFKGFFERILWQCVDSGLVDGSKIFMDSSLIRADASRNSVVKTKGLRRYIRHCYRQFESRLDGEVPNDRDERRVNSNYVSTTDPDCATVRHKVGPALPSYKVHRAVDVKSEIITAAEVTPADVNEASLLPDLIDAHNQNTQKQAEVVVADSQYGNANNYLECHDRGLEAHIPPRNNQKKGIYPDDHFKYDPQDDTYVCPQGNRLKCRRYSKRDKCFEYQCLSRICRVCPLRDRCTTSKNKGRTLQRHLRHDEIQSMREKARAPASQRDIKTRKHLMERSFARSVRLGFKRCRWRRLWRVQIQEYLTAAIQNILTLVRNFKEPDPTGAMVLPARREPPGSAALTGHLIGPVRPVPSIAMLFSKFARALLPFGVSRAALTFI